MKYQKPALNYLADATKAIQHPTQGKINFRRDGSNPTMSTSAASYPVEE